MTALMSQLTRTTNFGASFLMHVPATVNIYVVVPSLCEFTKKSRRRFLFPSLELVKLEGTVKCNFNFNFNFDVSIASS